MCILSGPPLSTRIAKYCQPQGSCILRKIKLVSLGSRGSITVKLGATCHSKEHLGMREVTGEYLIMVSCKARRVIEKDVK